MAAALLVFCGQIMRLRVRGDFDCGGRRGFRAIGRGCLRQVTFLAFCLRRPHFFQQRKKWGKERRQKPMVFGIPLAYFDAMGKSSAGNRPRFYPRCR